MSMISPVNRRNSPTGSDEASILQAAGVRLKALLFDCIVHSHTLSHTHARTHAQMHTHTHSHTHARTYTHVLLIPYALITVEHCLITQVRTTAGRDTTSGLNSAPRSDTSYGSTRSEYRSSCTIRSLQSGHRTVVSVPASSHNTISGISAHDARKSFQSHRSIPAGSLRHIGGGTGSQLSRI